MVLWSFGDWKKSPGSHKVLDRGGGSTVACERVVPVNMCIVCCNRVPDHKTSHVYSQAQAHNMFTTTNSV